MTKKAVALLSGGLDSTLAVRLVIDQGIEMEVINFTTLFCTCNSRGCCIEAKRVCEEFGIPYKLINNTDDFLKIVQRPQYGYGSGMNPCIDCRILMFKKAKSYMEELGASFLITGEVLGERPMSQRLDAMMLIEKESGLEGLILRPLSAKLLKPTVPEKMGIVDRNRLLGIQGRSRKPQIELAKGLGVNDYPCPSGGCLLTDKGFAQRMRDLFKYSADFTLNDVHLLKIGRHFRLSKDTKLIVGRDEGENKKILNLAREGDILFQVYDGLGALALARGKLLDGQFLTAAGISGRYSKAKDGLNVTVNYRIFPKIYEKSVTIKPLAQDVIDSLRI